MSGSIWGDSGVSLAQAGGFSRAPLPSGKWTGTPCYASVTSAVAANTLYGTPFIPAFSFTADATSIRIVTGGAGLCKIGVYTSTESTGAPADLLAEINTDMDTTSTATLSSSFISNPTFSAGRLYWLASCFSGTPSPNCFAGTGMQSGGIGWILFGAGAGDMVAPNAGISRFQRTAALTYVSGPTAFFPASFGAGSFAYGAPGAPLVALRKL